MMDYMHKILQVEAKVLPVTTDRAYIQAKLADGTIIENKITLVMLYDIVHALLNYLL